VHPSVGDPVERGRQRRLIAVLLAAPFLLGPAAVQALGGRLDHAMLVLGLCALSGICWLAALAIATTGRRAGLDLMALPFASAAVGLVIAGAGGAASPLALLAAAPAIEAWWVGRSRAAGLAGCAAAAVALAVSALAGPLLPPMAAISAAQWLVPVAYAATVWLRFRDMTAVVPLAAAEDGEAVETMLDAVVIRLSRTGEAVDVSAQARRIFDMQPELLLGGGLFERIHISDRLAYLTALADLREGAAHRKAEIRLRLPAAEGGQPAVRYRPFLFELAAAEAGSILAVVRDNAEMADMRRALAEAKDKADGQDLAKSRFLAAVSHELRTPLNAIIGFSDMLLHEVYGGFSDPRQKDYAGLIRDAGNHLLSVVNCILDVSKIESGAYSIHPEPFRFGEAAEMCRSMIAQQAEAKAIRLEDRVAANAGEIRGDRRAVRQILINLLSNAVKFTPEGGEVAVGARRLGSRLTFWVSDTGIGIAAEDLDRLGQPFMQVQNDYTRRYDGTGLGLSLVKGLVALHEGSMTIESAPGRGTTVTVSLPCDGPAGRVEPPAMLVAMATSGNQEENDGTFRKTA
jgi:cell cycle sensor histidine kinase DivJ